MKLALRRVGRHGLIVAICFVVPSLRAADSPRAADPVLDALHRELERSMAAFKTQPVPAYFLSYEVTGIHRYDMSASFGALAHSTESTTRYLDIDLRVGDAKLDNTHPLRGGGDAPTVSATLLALEDDPAAIRATVWDQTDQRYKAAVERLTKVKSNVDVMVADEDKSADFAAAPAVIFVQPTTDLYLDRAAWEAKLRTYSAPFAALGNVYEAKAELAVETQNRWYVNSEGSFLQITQSSARLIVTATTKADDGMTLPLHETFFAFTPDALPPAAEVLARVDRMIKNFTALRIAPVIDPYSGPAILSGRAAGVFFHEVFGHRIEGHRQKRADEGQTFKKMLGQRLLPENFDLFCDPTLRNFGATPLGGFYLYDNEGVPAQRVSLVEHGVLQGFLMARIPIEGFPQSNGHGRKAIGGAAVARQSNLMVEARHGLPHAALKGELLKLIAQQEKPYGLLIDDIESGFAITDRTMPNAFNVSPLIVYRIYPDGREELVRGANLIGTPLAAFGKIVAADDAPAVFNGMCGAESGWLPVATVSPGVLVSQIEIQKKEKSQDRLPLLPAPREDNER